MLLMATLQFLDIYINLDNNGTAEVEEEYHIGFPRDLLTEYQNRMLKNSVEGWWGFLNITYHINPAKGGLYDITLYPKAPKCSVLTGRCGAVVILKYKSRDLFIKTHPKPRYYEFSLNPRVWSFERTESGNVIIPPNVKICVYADDDLRIKEVFPPFERGQCWGEGIMAGWTLTYEYEEPLEKEISDFFNAFFNRSLRFLTSSEGLSFLFLLSTAVVSFIMIKNKVKTT